MLSRVAASALCALFVITPAGANAVRGAAAPPTSQTDSSAVRGPAPVISYRAPVSGEVSVVEPFRAPLSQYGPGHRGVDLATPTRTAAFAAAAGRVTFAGSVAGRGLVVLVHADGLITEYEPLEPVVRAGQLVAAGQRLGLVAGTHRGCGAGRCLHWGARTTENYFDPMSLLAELDRVRLLPW